jgi:hypothetical protein
MYAVDDQERGDATLAPRNDDMTIRPQPRFTQPGGDRVFLSPERPNVGIKKPILSRKRLQRNAGKSGKSGQSLPNIPSLGSL